MAKHLNNRQLLMAQLMLNGTSMCAAYVQAGYKGDPHQCAGKIAGNSKFHAYLEKIREKSERKAVSTREDRLLMLSRIAETNEVEDPRVSIQASDQLNKLTGEYSVERFQVKVEHSPLQIVMNSLRTNNTIEESAE